MLCHGGYELLRHGGYELQNDFCPHTHDLAGIMGALEASKDRPELMEGSMAQ